MFYLLMFSTSLRKSLEYCNPGITLSLIKIPGMLLFLARSLNFFARRRGVFEKPEKLKKIEDRKKIQKKQESVNSLVGPVAIRGTTTEKN